MTTQQLSVSSHKTTASFFNMKTIPIKVNFLFGEKLHFEFNQYDFFKNFNQNQSRICGKGVGLGLFPSDSLQSQLYEFFEIAHIDHTMVQK